MMMMYNAFFLVVVTAVCWYAGMNMDTVSGYNSIATYHTIAMVVYEAISASQLHQLPATS